MEIFNNPNILNLGEMLNINIDETNLNFIDNNYIFKFILKLVYPRVEKFNIDFLLKIFI
jgi:hypothetical protein